MIKNVGNVDKSLRILVGIALIALSATSTIGWWGYVLGAVALLTGVINFCPIYSLIGMNTCKTKN